MAIKKKTKAKPQRTNVYHLKSYFHPFWNRLSRIWDLRCPHNKNRTPHANKSTAVSNTSGKIFRPMISPKSQNAQRMRQTFHRKFSSIESVELNLRRICFIIAKISSTWPSISPNAPSKIPRITLRILAKESRLRNPLHPPLLHKTRLQHLRPRPLIAPKGRQLNKSSKTSRRGSTTSKRFNFSET